MYRNKLVLVFSLCIFYISGYSQSGYYVSTLAGDTAGLSQNPGANAGYSDGAAGSALFNSPTGMAIDTAGKNLYVADNLNNVIRKINTSTGMVTTIAGDTVGLSKYFDLDSNIGYQNGPALTAKFNNPWGVCVDDSGNVYIADTYNNVIRKLSATTGMVTTYAGKDSASTTFAGYINGADSIAEFYLPLSVAVDTAGNVYVTDEGNNAIRKISASTHIVTTIAGQGPDTIGYINGPVTVAELHGIYGITVAKSGAVFTSQFETGYNAIRKIYHDTVTTYAGYDSVGFDTNVIAYGPIPTGYENGKVSISSFGDLYSVTGDTLIGYYPLGVLFNGPTGITIDSIGNLLVADEYNNVIRMVTANDSVVSTFAGNDILGYRNGADSTAEFYNPMGVVADKKGNVYVADLGNNVIRKISNQLATGIPTVKKPINSLTVYPNPCNGRLNIVSSFNGQADLLDVTGRVVWTNNDFKSPYTFSTSAISPGIYFLRVTSASATEVTKIEVVK